MISTIISDEVAMLNIRNLKAEREKMGLSQEGLGHLLGVSASMLSQVETGKRVCTVRLYNQLANIFHWEIFFPGRKFNAHLPHSTSKPTLDGSTIPLNFEINSQDSLITTQTNTQSNDLDNPDTLNIRVGTRLKKQELSDLEAWAQAHGASISSAIRVAVIRLLQNN